VVYSGIKTKFSQFGDKMYGHSVDPPQIILWNVSADTVGYPAAADEAASIAHTTLMRLPSIVIAALLSHSFPPFQ
jgi:hypothetical protein